MLCPAINIDMRTIAAAGALITGCSTMLAPISIIPSMITRASPNRRASGPIRNNSSQGPCSDCDESERDLVRRPAEVVLSPEAEYGLHGSKAANADEGEKE